MRTLILCLTAALALGGAAAPREASPSGVPASRFLPPQSMAPALTLPPPPKEGSSVALSELKELRRIQARRTPAQFALAQRDAETENVTAFYGVMGSEFRLERLPATAKLFADLRFEDHVAAKRGKAFFQRKRPWIVDPSLETCPHGDDKARSSYPSGHATMAFAAAGVLARLDPPKAQAILARADQYAEERLVCGAHFRQDIVAGQALGTALAVKLMDTPAFRAEFDAAREELRAARIVP